MNKTKDDWNSMAKAYEEFNNAPDSYSYNIEWPCIKKMLPDIEGKSILDLGCGTGIFTFLLEAYKPERLMGIDLSEEMLEIARKKAVMQGSYAKFIQGDATKVDQYVDQKYDLIFSSTTTHYVENLTVLFENIAKCITDNGMIILSVIHPVYTAMYPIEHGDTFPDDEEWQIRYLDQSKRAYIQPWIEYNDRYKNHLSSSYHYLFSDYVNAIVKAGLKLSEVQEPMPPENWKEDCRGRYEGFIETPVYMILKITK